MEGAYLAIHTDTLREKEVSSTSHTVWYGAFGRAQHTVCGYGVRKPSTLLSTTTTKEKNQKKRERMGFSHCVMHHTVVSHTPENGRECVRFGERSFEWSVTGD